MDQNHKKVYGNFAQSKALAFSSDEKAFEVQLK